jgi:integrase/recombinase XerD
MTRTLESKLAPFIEGLIAEKRSCGYDFSLYASHLARFDSFTVKNGFDNGSLDEPLVSAWAVRLDTENQNSRNSRVRAVCELADYMESLGHVVFRLYRLGKVERSTPYIPSKEELGKLFSFIDLSKSQNKEFERFDIEYPMLARLYYHCGLRLSEAVMLKRTDVDFLNGTLYVRHSKGDKDRLVFPSEDFMAHLAQYDVQMDTDYIKGRQWFFPGFFIDKPFTKTTIDKKFKDWWMGTFPQWEGRRPTVQSLRHAFVVHRIDDWVWRGNELKDIMPYLSRYLGHSGIEQTMYYYHQLDARSKAVRLILEDCCPVVKGVDL